MTTKNTIKLPCPSLDRVLLAKCLIPEDQAKIVKKLRKVIEKSKPGNLDVIEYVKAMIVNVLLPEERKSIDQKLAGISKISNWNEVRNILAWIYNAIVEVYPVFRLEIVCDDLNSLTFSSVVGIDASDLGNIKIDDNGKIRKGSKLDSIADILDFERLLKANVVGQNEAIEIIINSLKLKAVGFCKRRVNSTDTISVPLNLMFVGKSGVGKSYCAKLLGEKYSSNFWRINCAEFSHGHEINKFLGSPPGYIGGERNSVLKEKSSISNKWTILFDEIEKAQDKLFNLLLSWMEDGYIVDNSGNECDFSESFFIFTTNSGVRDLKTKTLNWNKSSSKESSKEELEKAILRDFSDEFRNRIDEIVYFNDLSKEDAAKIAEISLRQYPVKRTDEIINFVVDNAFSEMYGAREVARFIKKNIALPIADSILAKKLPKTANFYDLAVNNGKIEVVNTL